MGTGTGKKNECKKINKFYNKLYGRAAAQGQKSEIPGLRRLFLLGILANGSFPEF
jgi:hypothetical protein